MIIEDKVLPYYTGEDLTRLEELDKESLELFNSLDKEDRLSDSNRSIMDKINQLEKQANNIRWDVENRYIKDRKPKGLLEDVREIVGAITKEDFLERLQSQKHQIDILRKEGVKEEELALLKKYTEESYDNCYSYILFYLRVQLNGLDELGTEKAIAIVEKRVGQWYIKPEPAYFPMAHGKATDALAFMSGKSAKVDRITKNASFDKFGVQLAVLKLEELRTTLGIGFDKLFSTATGAFTKQNDFRHLKGKEPNREVSLSLREYAKLLGYDVEEKETSTPEEAEAEKKRAKHALDNARKAIKKDLLLLQASTLRWEENIKGKQRDFDSISLVTRVAIRNGEIKIAFSPEIANYLVERNLITQYPTKLLKISGRKPTAYYIGRKLAEHYNIDNNQLRGTHDRISIPALLAVTDLPSYEDVERTDRGHWERRIKDPLEEALDTLTEEGVLKDWKYTHAKGVELTEEEAYNITSYKDFASLYLLFTPADKVDHTDRIEAKQEARAKARSKHKANKKK